VILTTEDVEPMTAKLVLTDERRRRWMVKCLADQTMNYIHVRDFLARMPRGQSLKRVYDDAREKLQAARKSVEALPFNAQMSLKWILEKRAGSDRSPYDSGLQALTDLIDAVDELQSSLAGRTVRKLPRFALDWTVGAMMLILERSTGNRAMARRRPPGGSPPTFLNEEAKVIGVILRSADGALTDTTLINKIEATESRYRGKSLDCFEPALLVGGKVTPF
jgi:hypothetical protein